MHISSYLEELSYIWGAVPNWRHRAQLLSSTVLFHLNNGLGRLGKGKADLHFELLVDGQEKLIFVRPNRGDLFILYEVLAREAYAIPSGRLDPKEVNTILDCGANIGLTSIYFAQKYPQARIIAIEPDPENVEILKANVSGIDRIIPIRAAVVGGRSRPVYLSSDQPAYGNRISSSDFGTRGVEVPGLTIFDICRRNNIEKVDLLKVDIEGAEQEVFAAPDFLRMVRMVAIELHAPYGVDDFSGDISDFGFRVEAPSPTACRLAHLAEPVG